LVAWYVFENCHDIYKYVARLITLGTPNLGLYTTPVFGTIEKNDNMFSALRGYLMGTIVKKIIIPLAFCENCPPNDYLHKDGKFPELIEQLNLKHLDVNQEN